jgi:hypothetical protein
MSGKKHAILTVEARLVVAVTAIGRGTAGRHGKAPWHGDPL